MLRAHISRLGVASALMVGVVCFAVAGVGLLVGALYSWLSAPLGPTGAAAVCGGVCLLIAVAGALAARRLA